MEMEKIKAFRITITRAYSMDEQGTLREKLYTYLTPGEDHTVPEGVSVSMARWIVLWLSLRIDEGHDLQSIRADLGKLYDWLCKG